MRTSSTPGAARDEVRPIEGENPRAESSCERRYVPDDDVPVGHEVPTGCVVMERHYELERHHGRQAVGHYAEVIERCLPALAVLATDERAAGGPRLERPRRLHFEATRPFADDRRRPMVPTQGPLLFFDLETTGLSGGAGTIAFLVGCGYFDGEGFHVVQYFLSGYHAEHELLVSLAALTEKFGGLVTFNGRTFDVPLIETRYLFHRLSSPFGDMPHFDMLHPARRLWRRRGDSGAGRDDGRGADSFDQSSCALGALEEAVLGVHRVDDVPGSEIPSRYFHYLRTGDLQPLEPVFEHNRLDLISLAALTALGMRMVDGGAEAVPSPHEALAMGQIYERLGRSGEAEAHFARAAGLDPAPWDARSIDHTIRAEALHHLAVHRRRQRRYAAAAEAWHGMLDAGAGQPLAQEARRALAIHHEHRCRNLDAARAFVLHALESERDPAQIDALRHRLARLDRKRLAGREEHPDQATLRRD
ncbi:MAG: ribonuclease H-like domain-containing protein [Acidobacteria bacterium]|nr:ribonuclease H-like domain-containing protein [Acidobacteriota bacterium]